jgi:hypothetical protein
VAIQGDYASKHRVIPLLAGASAEGEDWDIFSAHRRGSAGEPEGAVTRPARTIPNCWMKLSVYLLSLPHRA